MSLRKLRAGRIATANASTWVGEYGTIFYNEASGALRISDGVTPGGNPLSLVASDFQFTFGDFEATTPADGSASLSSVNPDQDINIYSNGDGAVNVIGEFNVFPPDGSIYSREPIFRVSNDGQVRMLVPGADSAAGAVNIVGGLDGVFQPPVNSGVMLHVTGIAGTPGVPSRIYNDSQNAFSAFVARRYNNTAASPSAVLDGEEIMRLSGTAHNGTNIPGTANNRIVFKALGNQTLTNAGGNIEFWTTPQNSTTLTKVATVDNTDGITATKFTGPLTGNVTGNVSGSAGSVAAANITGTTLASNVVTSSLTSTGTLNNLIIAAGTNSVAPLKLTSGTNLTTASAGNIEYNGTTFFGTSSGTQRGIIPTEMVYLLNADRSITFNTTTAQSLFGVSPTLTANTRYYFRLKAIITRTTGDNNTALTLSWGGNATLDRVSYTCQSKNGAIGTLAAENLVEYNITSNFGTGVALVAISNPPSTHTVIITGVIGVGASGGTVIPNITWTGATAAGAVTVTATSNWQIHPISAIGANTSVGNWA